MTCGIARSSLILQEKLCLFSIDAAHKDSKRLSIGSNRNQKWRSLYPVDYGRLLHEPVPRIGAASPVNLKPDNNVAGLQFRSWETDHDGQLRNFRLPVAVVLFDIFR